MGPGVISFLFAIGSTTWIYTKFQKYSGNNTKAAIIASIISGLVIFFIFFSILSLIFK
jgi:phosphate starvation-inducible membrane PsiE